MMAEFGEQHGAVGQGDACGPNLLAALRIECCRGRVQPVAQVPTALHRIGLGRRGRPKGRCQMGIGSLAIIVGDREPQASVVQSQC